MTDIPPEDDVGILPVSELATDGEGGRPRVSLLALSVALVFGLALGAWLLGVGRGERSPEDRFASVPGAVQKAESFTYEMDVATTAGSLDTSIRIEGAVDVATNRSRATMDLLGQQMEVVTEGTTAYVKVASAVGSAAAGGRPWMRIQPGQLNLGVGQGDGTNPLDTFARLAAPGAAIERVGEEDVRGTSTTHFRTRLDLSTPATASLGLGDQLSAVPVDVWLDDANRPRRERFRINLTVPQSTAGAIEVVTTIEAFDYAKFVTIAIPPADEVGDPPSGALSSILGPN